MTSPPQPCSVEVRGGLALLARPERRRISCFWTRALPFAFARPASIALVISSELLEVLACPKCKQRVELTEDGTALVCSADQLRYPIVDGIPVMLIEEAKPEDDK